MRTDTPTFTLTDAATRGCDGILKHTGYVVKTAKKMSNNNRFLADDLIQEGMLGLIEAERKYDPDKGIKFLSFARHDIHAKMFLHKRHFRKPITIPRGFTERDWWKEMKLTEEEFFDNINNISSDLCHDIKDNGDSQLDKAIDAQEREILHDAINAVYSRVSDKGRQIIRERILARKIRPLKDIAKEWGVSVKAPSHMCQRLMEKITKEALVKLREVKA
jgi:RNA polymerase sigma factor (sigma-70 family)